MSSNLEGLEKFVNSNPIVAFIKKVLNKVPHWLLMNSASYLLEITASFYTVKSKMPLLLLKREPYLSQSVLEVKDED